MYFKISVLSLFVFLVAGCGNLSLLECNQKLLKEMNRCDISYDRISQGHTNCYTAAQKEHDDCMAKAYGNKPY